MEGFTIVDGVVLLIVAISALLAFSRGLVRELLSIAGWVGAAIAAYFFAPMAEPFVREIPFLRDFIAESCQLSIFAAFAVVFAVALVLISIFTPLLSGAVQNSALGSIDRGFGLLFGVARGALLVAIGLLLYENFLSAGDGIPQVEDSRSKEIFASLQATLNESIPEDAPTWLEERYGVLVAGCGEPETTETDA
ncbi:CvpA family protein [Oceanomicrobium pacificus]|uniref:CvpA family protein n=1 Tax=Oceanomicrobium pacificus TaxID=2692916 RepID=A0A6B0TM63_9RHOB|nr:CvpA family protein [Oceanomicrobium pacificus]MXU65650.1 CvpA family protein [Oceanomicrobium pacificus]